MDDVICSLPNIETARLAYQQLVQLFKAGGFQLAKWSSNSNNLLDEIPAELRLAKSIEFDASSVINSSSKVLGLQWDPVLDTFSFSLDLPAYHCSKRRILSTLTRIWDPLGFLSPVTFYAKLLIKELWISKIGWDDNPPALIEKLWRSFYQELHCLLSIKIPRHIGGTLHVTATICAFCDASEKGYGALVYLKIDDCNEDAKFINLIYAKSKVAPLKVQTIARLELCAAVLLTKLLKFVLETLSPRLKIQDIFACTDSTVVLSWLNAPANRWKIFVANRVAKIQESLSIDKWYHIDGKSNPADCLSRGLMPSALANHSEWVSGPSWLRLDSTSWPIRKLDSITPVSLELRPVLSLAVTVEEGNDNPLRILSHKISDHMKLIRMVVYVLRFIKKLPRQSSITPADLNIAERKIIAVVQASHFAEEIRLLQSNKICSPKFRPLSLFLEDGLLRVGGRLGNAPLSYDQKHPYLLPKKDPFVNSLIDFYHKSNLHTGPHLLLSLLRQKYWILSARNVVRSRVKLCNLCFKFKPKPSFPLMADLPASRVSECKSFLHTGVDYSGPFMITLGRHRGAKSQKAYLCLFVCLTTKAIHLELASSLSTETFLSCFKRFLARRGPCKYVYSDRGTNFIGAKAELDEIHRFVISRELKDGLEIGLASHRINWNFNPPSAPHFGGIWEANIKSVKTHLFKVIGSQILTYEELATVLIQIEALLNSRPLCCLSPDPAEPLALTPAHFLTLTPLQELPAIDVSDKAPNLLTRKELLDNLVQSFWKRWRLEYLNTLQIKAKWNTPSNPIKKDTVVLIQTDNVAPLQWPMGVIEEVYRGQDGVVRVVLVRSRNKTFKRPVVKLCPLPSQ